MMRRDSIRAGVNSQMVATNMVRGPSPADLVAYRVCNDRELLRFEWEQNQSLFVLWYDKYNQKKNKYILNAIYY